jgi:hypothetical protein
VIGWLAAILVLVFLVVARWLLPLFLALHRYPARRADCPVVRSGNCPDDHDCEDHS